MHYPRKERIFSEKPRLYVPVCPDILCGSFTENAFLRCKIEKTDNKQRAVCYKNIGQLAICAGSSCTN